MAVAPPETLASSIQIQFEGRSIPAVAGEPVGVALLRAGERILSRSVKYHRPRGLHCLAEQCASCLMRIGGEPNRFACTTPCSEGLTVARQNAFPSAGRDVLRTIDWATPYGLNHHEMLAGFPVAEDVMALVARQLAGFGELPDLPTPAVPSGGERRVALCLVGLGRAGSAAATRLAEAGLDAVALERRPGSQRTGLESWFGAEVLGIYPRGKDRQLLVRREGRLELVQTARLLLCTGSRAQSWVFRGNDLPGVFTADGALRLIERHGLLPGRQLLIAGTAEVAARLETSARQAGAEVTRLDAQARILRARGGRQLAAVDWVDPDQEPQRWRGEALAIAGNRAAAFELGVQAGAVTAYDAEHGFALQVNERGQTLAPDLWAAGSCCAGTGDSEAQGRRAAEAILG